MGGVDTAPEMERMTDMRVYADQAATTSLSKTALEAMLPWMTENFGNPSALYEEGRTARDAVETAREKIAHLLHAKAKEIYFTSGGTEADNWALQMAAAAGARSGRIAIFSSSSWSAASGTGPGGPSWCGAPSTAWPRWWNGFGAGAGTGCPLSSGGG